MVRRDAFIYWTVQNSYFLGSPSRVGCRFEHIWGTCIHKGRPHLGHHVDTCSWDAQPPRGSSRVGAAFTVFFSVCVCVCVCAPVLQGRPAVPGAVAEDVRQVLWQRGVPHHPGGQCVFCGIRRKEFYLRLFPRTQKVRVCFQSGNKI